MPWMPGSPATPRSCVAIAWMGYDQPKSLGVRETGGGLALPIVGQLTWARRCKGVPESPDRQAPEGVVMVAGDWTLEENAGGCWRGIGGAGRSVARQARRDARPAQDTEAEKRKILEMFGGARAPGQHPDDIFSPQQKNRPSWPVFCWSRPERTHAPASAWYPPAGLI